MNVLNFATVDDYVEWSLRDLPHDLVTDFTIAFWAKITASDAGGVIFSEEIASGADLTGLTMDFGASNFLYFVDKGVNVSAYEVTTYTGAWHHFAYVFTATNVYLYIDGVLTFTGSGPLTQGFKKGSKMRIGKSPAGDLPSSIFKICNFHIYLRELNLTEINKILQYQSYYFDDLETYFKLDALTGRFVNPLTGATYSYVASGVVVEATNALDIYNFKYAQSQVPQAAFSNALKESQRVTIPKMTTVGELLFSTGRDLTGCSVLDLFIKDSAGNLVLAPYDPYVWYHFDEYGGIAVQDSSLHDRDGIITTPVPYSPASFSAGKLNNAFTCPGESESQSFVNCGDIANFEWDEPFSLDCWVNQTPGYDVTVAGKYNATQQKGWFLAIQEGYLLFELIGNRDTSNWLQVYSAIQITQGTFQHIAVTYDGSGVAAGVKFYINGVLITNSVYLDGLAGMSIVPTSTNFCIGAILDAGWGFIGKIDEFAVYEKVLSQTDVDFRYNAGSGTARMLPSNFIAPISGMIVFPISPPTLETPGTYQCQLKYGNDLFVDFSPIHTLEVLDTLD